MMKCVILFALVAATTADLTAHLNPLSPTGRIIGGVATSIDQVPYQVSLQAFGFHICGGSIISQSWILSAAHCMVYSSQWYAIHSGSTLLNSGGVSSSVSDIISHMNYGYNAWGIPINDIALMQLSSPLIFGTTQAPIPLYNSGQDAIVGAPAVITGWGAVQEGGSSSSVLQTVTVPIVSKADCSAAYSIWGGLPADQICAAVPEGGLDACQGDSGGPLAIAGVLAGVVSWGNGCARAGFPGVYAEVAAYRAWISANSGV